jgi:hypothetical protein
MIKQQISALAAAAALALIPIAADAEGNLASQPTTLELAIDGRNLTFSATEYTLETGKYYRWVITSDGIEEIMVQAPDLFRNSWINQIVIDEVEVHAIGAIYGIEFDDEGTAVMTFVPIRPGNYEFYAPGYQDRGLSGTFIVR